MTPTIHELLTRARPTALSEMRSTSHARENQTGDMNVLRGVEGLMGSEDAPLAKCGHHTKNVQHGPVTTAQFPALTSTETTVWKRLRKLPEPITALSVQRAMECSKTMAERYLRDLVRKQRLEAGPRGHRRVA